MRPQSLVVAMLKEKYFKYTNVLEAKVRSNASMMCKSKMSSKEIIEAGAQWRVWNGEKIKI